MKSIIAIFFSFFIVCAVKAQNPEGLFINSKAPEFRAKDQNGNEISLKELRKKGNVVIVFYRGNWCPYCNKFLRKLQDSLQLITDKKATVVAITPEAGEGIDSTVKKTGAAFPIIYDKDMKIADNYQVAFKIDDRTIARYKNAGIDLAKINDQKEVSLPVPAVYVVNTEGSVTFRYFDVDYKRRVPIREILKALN